jgi:dipeptidyl aminopeptidase/acylaminoacyl peptidase
MPRTLTPAVFFVLVFSLSSPAAGTHDITVEDYFTLAAIAEVALSPDGKHAAYAESRWQKEADNRKADLWVVEVPGGNPRRLTDDRPGVRSLRWGPDGSIYFLAARSRAAEKQPPFDGKTQVWKATLDGREPVAITRVTGGVTGFDLTADGGTLLYTVSIDAPAEDDHFKELRERYKGVEYGRGPRKISELWRLDLRSWRADKLPAPKRFIYQVALTREGSRAALITAPDDQVITYEGRSRVQVLDVASDKVETLPDKLWRADAPSPYAWLEALAWSPDGKRLAFNAVFDAYPAEVVVTEWEAGRPVSHLLPRGGVTLRGYGTPLQWRTPTELCYLSEEKCRVRLAEKSYGGEAKTWDLGGEVVVSGFSFDAAGKHGVVLLADTERLPELYPIEAAGKLRKLTDLNPQTATWKLPRVSVVTWKGAGGVDVYGVLQLPADHQEGKRLPLAVGIHGGPTTADYAQQQYEIWEGQTLLPSRGYVLLLPNYRGSTGNGDKFVTDLIGHENDVEVEDILKGVDALIERGIADPERLAVLGWSNGGYLTNCLIAKTTRFKAASSGAGILDTVMEWGTNDEPAYPTVFKQGFPWQKPDSYRRTSPTYDLEKVKTPTLIHVGGSDERCPPGHSRMLYRALHEYLKVPTELAVYPGEPHGLTKYTNRKAKMEWDLAWFDRHVLDKGKK